ncbi:DUF1707 domain-containing protein [soil metagenome]
MSESPEQPNLRVSDHEREQVFERLTEHAAAGRLTLQELEDRVQQAYGATTRAELERVTRDMPEVVRPATPTRRNPTRWVVALMGGSARRGRWRVSERVNAVAVMGGSGLDLRNVEFDGDELTILAVAVLGGIDIYVPDTVEVQVDDLAVLGGNDERGSRRPARPGAPVVRVKAYALMGGVDVWRLPTDARQLPLRQAKRAARALEK